MLNSQRELTLPRPLSPAPRMFNTAVSVAQAIHIFGWEAGCAGQGSLLRVWEAACLPHRISSCSEGAHGASLPRRLPHDGPSYSHYYDLGADFQAPSQTRMSHSAC